MMTMSINRLEWLRGQMEQGWWVEGPVIERATRIAYSSSYSPAHTFEFVLRHDFGYQAVAVPESPELHAFIDEQALPIIAL